MNDQGHVFGSRQISQLDVVLFTEALTTAGAPAAHLFRARRSRPAHHAALLEADEVFAFEYQGDYKQLTVELAAGLGSVLEKSFARELKEEALQRIRFFISLSGDPSPRIALHLASEVPSLDGAPLALLSPLLGPEEKDAWLGLAPGSVQVVKAEAELPAAASPGGDVLLLSVRSSRPPVYLGSGSENAATPDARDVVLVSMPFGMLARPSLGLSLLQPALNGVHSEILYFTLAFAERVGIAFYAWICNSNPSEEALVGEWIFSRSTDGATAYLKEILGDLDEALVDELLMARSKVDAFLDDCIRDVLARRPKIVGFTSMFQQHQASLALAGRLKAACPEVTILFGGANCEGQMGLETLRSFEFIDAVVSGEADLIFADLVGRLLGGEDVSAMEGVTTRDGLQGYSGEPLNGPLVTDMDSLPRPDFSDFFRQWETIPAFEVYPPGLLMETSRGCWWGAKHHCTFCGLNGKGMGFRSKSAQRALDELTELIERYPGAQVSMADNILDLQYFKTLVPALAERGAPVDLFFETKANLTKDQIRLLREAGISTIQPGVESFSDDVLGIMRKGVSGLQNVQLLKWCLEIGVWPFWNLLWGFPGEPSAAYAEMAELIPWLHHLPPPEACGPLRLDRFSPNFDQAAALGFTEVKPFRAYRHIYPLADEALANIAYYFDYSYRDGRDTRSYTEGLAEGVAEWKEAYRGSHLMYTDKGNDLLIWDLRGAACRKLTLLGGLERTLYLECDGIRSLGALQKAAALFSGQPVRPGEVEEIVAPWIRDGLMLRQGSKVLALAVPDREADDEGDTG